VKAKKSSSDKGIKKFMVSENRFISGCSHFGFQAVVTKTLIPSGELKPGEASVWELVFSG